MKKHLYFIASVFCPFFLSGAFAQEIERMSPILPVDEEIEQLEYVPTDVNSIVDPILKMPVVKAPVGFTPNMINDHQIPNPIEKVKLIKPPYANNQGSVKLTYDFEFTPAKNGMSPDFQLTYDSHRGYGLLGMGWDMLLPQIEVDTTVENWKKNYGACFLNGQRYIPYTDEYDVKMDQDQDVEYRAENDLHESKLIRHSRISYQRDDKGKVVKDESGKGKLQGVYIYWELINRDGRRMVFGNRKNPFHYEKEVEQSSNEQKKEEFQNNSRLFRKSNTSDGEGVMDTLVAKWNISYQHDFYGNYIDYMYSLSNNLPFIDSITVGNANKIPHTIIKFKYMEQQEGEDSIVHYKNYGIDYTMKQLLDSVNIYYENDEEQGKYDYLRGYKFTLKRGVPEPKFRNHAKVMTKIEQLNDQRKSYAAHDIEYYNDKDDIRRRKEYYRNTQDKKVLPFLQDRSLMVKTIHNPLGGCMSFDYKTSDYPLTERDLAKIVIEKDEESEIGEDGIEYAPIKHIKYPVDSCGHILVLATMRVSNGIQNFVHDTFDYKGQVWNKDSSLFFGFDTVQTHVLNPKDRERVKVWEKEYDMLDPQLRGLINSATLYDSKMEKQLKKFIMNYKIYEEHDKFYSVKLKEKYIKYPASLQYSYIIVMYEYDRIANRVNSIYINTDHDWIGPKYTFKYLAEDDCHGGMWGLMSKLICDYKGETYCEMDFKYSDAKNPDRVTELSQYVSIAKKQGETSRVVTTTFQYDAEGNMIQVNYPQDANGKNMTMKYNYDRRFNMYLNQVENSIGYRTELGDYDYYYGIPRYIMDQNGMKMEQTTDKMGHIISIKAPDEVETDGPSTLEYKFELAESPIFQNDSNLYPFRDTLTTDATEAMLANTYGKESLMKVLSYFYKIPDKEITGLDEAGILHKFNVCTTPWDENDKKKDIIVKLDSADASKCLCKDSTSKLAYSVKITSEGGETLIFSDGLGRIAQTKQLRAVTNVDMEANKKGETKNQYLVTHAEDEPMYLDGRIYDHFAGELEKRREYQRGGELQNVRTYNEYGLLAILKDKDGNPLATHTYTFDEGKTTHTINSLFYGANVTQTDFDGNIVSETYTLTEGRDSTHTRRYDKMGKLLTSKEGSRESFYKYDMRGLVIEKSTPEDGKRTYTYDDAGNLISESKDGQEIIKYKYDYNRLVAVEYPNFPYNNIKLHYGDKNAKYNRVGQIAYVEDAVGVQELFYGNMGEISKIRRTIVAPNRPIRTFEMTWDYNSFNRPVRMTYPDQEMLSYTYDINGFPMTVKGSKSYNYEYVNDAGYDLLGRPTYLSYCNGENTFFSYDDDNETMDQKVYSMRDEASTMSANYQYGFYKDFPARETKITGTLFDKSFRNDSYRWMYGRNLYGKASYENGNGGQASYEYLTNELTLAPSVNAVSFLQTDIDAIGEGSMTKEYDYDKNGKLIVENEELILNPEGKPEIKNDGGYLTTYWYDYTGYPVISTGGGKEGVYVNGLSTFSSIDMPSMEFQLNKYFSMNDTMGYTKHVFFGDEEVVRKTGDNASYGQNPEREERAGTYFAGQKSDYKTLYEQSSQAFKNRYALLNLELEQEDLPYRDGKDVDKENAPAALRSSNIGHEMDNYEENQLYIHRINGNSIYYMTNLRANLEDVIFITPFESKRLFKHVK